MKNLKQRHPALVEQAQELRADKGYDSEPNNRKLLRDHRVKPLIDIRSMWKEKETRLIDDTRADNIVWTSHARWPTKVLRWIVRA